MKNFLINRGLHTILLLALLGGALYERERDDNWVKSLRYIAFDTFNRIEPRESNNQVVIADIDEVSLQDNKLGQWPWPRTDVARLVESLSEMGAKAVVFDIVFAEEDRTSPAVMLRKVPDALRSNELVSTFQKLPDHDQVLAETFLRAGNVVTGFVWSSLAQSDRRAPIISKSILFGKGTETLRSSLYLAPSMTGNIQSLEDKAAGNGNFGQIPDSDGIIRSVPLLFTSANKHADQKFSYYPSLALEAIRVAEAPKEQNKVRALKPNELSAISYPFLLKRGEHEIPLDLGAAFYVHFSPFDETKYIPAYKIIERSISPDIINGKIVLIGTSSIGLKDTRSTPLNLSIPGVDVHRNIIEQIMQGRFLSRPSLIKPAEFIFTALVALLAIVVSPFVNALLLGGIVVLLVGAVNYFSFWSFLHQGLLIDPVYPSVTILLIFFLSSFLTYLRTEIERRSIKDAFGHYISPDYMNELTKNPNALQLGGVIKPVTIMFTDVRGFTGISEKLAPDELIQLMNDFLTPMSDVVMSHRGTIDKYMGDAMMAFWNAPLDDAQHQRNACLAALEMKSALIPINKKLEETSKQKGIETLVIRAGVGINSGEGAVGNMGSRQRFAYSVLGDTVNLASRLEGQTKAYGVDILIGEETYKEVSDFATLELDLLRVKGKDKPVRIYALFDDHKNPSFLGLESVHADMLKAYRSKEWEKTLGLINKCLENAPDSMKKYYNIMQGRIANLQKESLPMNWDGVYSATSK